MAGLDHRSCRGVLAVTDDDSANLAVAIALAVLGLNLLGDGLHNLLNPHLTHKH